MATVPIKDVPAVAANVTPIGEAPSLNPAGGRVGPKVILSRQMNLPDLTMIQRVVEDWAEHKDVIADLDQADVKRFLTQLRKSRTAYTRLIELVTLKTKDDVPTPRANGASKGAEVPSEPPAKAPVKRTAKTPRKTAKAPAKAPAKAVAVPTGETLAAKAAEVAAKTETKDA
jgi:hypothetical protein